MLDIYPLKKHACPVAKRYLHAAHTNNYSLLTMVPQFPSIPNDQQLNDQQITIPMRSFAACRSCPLAARPRLLRGSNRRQQQRHFFNLSYLCTGKIANANHSPSPKETAFPSNNIHPSSITNQSFIIKKNAAIRELTAPRNRARSLVLQSHSPGIPIDNDNNW